MPVVGVPKFDAVVLMSIEAINFTQGSPALVGHGAFVSTVTGDTFGKTTCRHFSKNTLIKLAELRAAMEEDLATLVFESDDTAARQFESTTEEPRGLREEHGTTDAESV